MTRQTMEEILIAIRSSDIQTIDLTGGAPEMNPNFRWFVEELSLLKVKIIVRCNLTIILSNPSYHYLPEFYKEHNVTVICSLPHFSERRTDAQRGDGVFEKSIRALRGDYAQAVDAKTYGQLFCRPNHAPADTKPPPFGRNHGVRQ